MTESFEPIRMNPFSEYALLTEDKDYAKSEIVILQIRGKVDVAAFVESYEQALKSVPMLSCNLTEKWVGGKFVPFWVPNPDVPNRMVVEDCRHMVKEPFVITEFSDLYFAQTQRRRLDLFREYPFKGYLLRVGQDLWLLCLVFHHSAMDPFKGYKVMSGTIASYHEKVTGQMPDWFGAAGSLASARKTNYMQPIPIMTFAKEQLNDVWIENRASVISGIATQGIRPWREVKGRHCHHTIFEDQKLIGAIVDRAIKMECTFNDALLAITRQVLSQWNKDHGKPADRFRMMLATSLIGRAKLSVESGAALGGLNFISAGHQDADLDTLIKHYGQCRRSQLSRGVDVTFHLTLDRLVDALRVLPLAVRLRMLRPAIERIPCTASLSNTGSIWPKSVDEVGRQSLESKVVDIGGLRIEDWHTNVSIARNLGIGLTCRTYNTRFFLDFVYDRFRFTAKEAKELTDRIVKGIHNAA